MAGGRVAERLIHVTVPGGAVARCGAMDGELISWEEAVDPADPRYFTCGACWRDASGGVEPMGGSLR